MNKIFNAYNFKIWGNYCLTTFSVASFILTFVLSFPEDKQFVKYIIGGVLLILLVISYAIIAAYQFKSKIAKIKINNTNVNIYFGDILSTKEKKVIAFNEYFDTQVDDVIISHKSLNGQVLDRKLIDRKKFDKAVENSQCLKKGELNSERPLGKKQRYDIGQILPFNDFFILAFARFNDDNEAELLSNEYANCLLDMWKQLNKYYAQNTINIPLLGSGITRILKNIEVSNQELLEIMLETLKISKMTFKEPSQINIILYPGKNNEYVKKYDFIRIKSLFGR